MGLTSSGIASDDRGSGQPVLLFLPGWCGPHTLFDPATARVESSFRTLAVDWRGHGGSKPVVGDFGFADQVEDAQSTLRS